MHLTTIPKHGHKSLQSPEASSKAVAPAVKPSKSNHITLHAAMVQVCSDARQIISHDPQLYRMFRDFAKMWSVMHLHPVDGYDRLNDLYSEIDNLVCRIIADALRRQGLRWISFDAHIVPPHLKENAHITLTVWPWMRKTDRQVRMHMEIQV